MRPCGRGLGSVPAGLAKFLGLADDVVGGQHEHERVADRVRPRARRQTATAGPESRRTGSSTMSASMPLLAQLLGHDEAEIGIGDDDRAREQARGREMRASTCWNVDAWPDQRRRTASACSRARPATAAFPRRRT